MTTTVILRLCTLLLACGLGAVNLWADDALAVLKTKTETYANVTVISQTKTHLFVQHSRGVANLKIQDLDLDALRALGVVEANQAPEGMAAADVKERGEGASESTNAQPTLLAAWKERLPANIEFPPLEQKVKLILLTASFGIYLFFCYCCLLICTKSGAEPGILIWVPVLQLLPLLRAARMSGWWFLLWLVPVVNVIAQVIWCFKIATARGKGVFTAILLLLPLTSIFAFLYLAFSGGSASESDDDPKPLRIDPLPA
jgi:hypothetical protein